jgi:hypothetical protein
LRRRRRRRRRRRKRRRRKRRRRSSGDKTDRGELVGFQPKKEAVFEEHLLERAAAEVADGSEEPRRSPSTRPSNTRLTAFRAF